MIKSIEMNFDSHQVHWFVVEAKNDVHCHSWDTLLVMVVVVVVVRVDQHSILSSLLQHYVDFDCYSTELFEAAAGVVVVR